MLTVEEALKKQGAYHAGDYDIVVIGAGHAGCEAALAAARLGMQTLLLTMNLDAVANMPCNPSIGGTAKGQLVREIDALGGEMGKAADQAMIQFRMLNASKGPAVLSPRAQIDRRRYQVLMKHVIERQQNLHLRQGEVISLLAQVSVNGKQQRITGVQMKTSAVIGCRAVILATGTYLESKIIIGACQFSSGPDSMFPSIGLAASLRTLGLPLQRFKTGTPARVNRTQIDFSVMDLQDGDKKVTPFSYMHRPEDVLQTDQIPCFLTWTSEETRHVIEANLNRSPLFSGEIDGIGPRYCPSIEDKYVKFPDKKRHQIFIEPTGSDTEELYLQGFSSSMPEDVQVKMLHSLPGLQHTQMMRSAYAIEYDCIDPTCLQLSLETRKVENLFCAGQINGSSGYEEAAAQGLVAGVNAVRKLRSQPAVMMDRSQSYIGVLIDDLITKGTAEPYRMMTSRAEYRLVLRQDNADARLTPVGREIGLIDDKRWQTFRKKQQRIVQEIARCRKKRIRPAKQVNEWLESKKSACLQHGVTIADLLRRPELTYQMLAELDEDRPVLSEDEQFTLEVQLKYEGYIALELNRIHKFNRNEEKKLPDDLDYLSIPGLRIEAKQKLDRLRPGSIGQASRISGVSPADISVLLVYLRAGRGQRSENQSDQ